MSGRRAKRWNAVGAEAGARRADDGVGEHEAGDARRAIGERAQADGAAPVLADEDEPAAGGARCAVGDECVEERAEPARVVLERVHRRIARLVGEAETDESGMTRRSGASASASATLRHR